MGWLFGIVIILVLAGTAYAASGRLGSMPAQIDDRPGPDLKAGPISAAELREVRFDIVSRGYHPQQVEAVLDALSEQLASAEQPATDSAADSPAPSRAAEQSTEEQSAEQQSAEESSPEQPSEDDDGGQLGRRGIIGE